MAYEHTDIEKKWQDEWRRRGTYRHGLASGRERVRVPQPTHCGTATYCGTPFTSRNVAHTSVAVLL